MKLNPLDKVVKMDNLKEKRENMEMFCKEIRSWMKIVICWR